MSTVRFLSSVPLWHEIQQRVKSAKSARVAVAYFGKGGAKLLPLKRGSRLVVDLSMRAVEQGATNPREIRTLINRGVQVFTRERLHAKMFIFDDALIVGSSNVSRNSHDRLDEAGILTNDRAALRRARELFDGKLCGEPVRSNYLAVCEKAYRPPRFKALREQETAGTEPGSRIVEAGLWFVGGLVSIEEREDERTHIRAIEKRARKLLRNADDSDVSWTRFRQPNRLVRSVRPGDCLIECMRDGNEPPYVFAPARVLTIESFVAPKSKRVHLITTEKPNASEGMPLTDFRRRIRSILPKLDSAHPRTTPILDQDAADKILQFWTPAGRLSRRKRKA